MTRALVTLAVGSGYERLLEIALPSFTEFADRHGHHLIIATPRDCDRPASWLKIPALHDALASHDEALWLDADTVIVDTSQDLQAPPGAWQALVAHHTGDGFVPNAGVWLLRQPMLAVLEQIWGMTEYLSHGWWEQAALHKLMGYTRRPVQLGQPTPLHSHTHFLDAGWNVHLHDAASAGRSRILHATMHPDREAAMRTWADSTRSAHAHQGKKASQ